MHTASGVLPNRTNSEQVSGQSRLGISVPLHHVRLQMDWTTIARKKYINTFKIAQARKATGMTTVEYRYDIGASVRIKAIDLNGKVDSLSLDNNGKMYRVVYWSNCTRNQVWMYEWELDQFGTKLST